MCLGSWIFVIRAALDSHISAIWFTLLVFALNYGNIQLKHLLAFRHLKGKQNSNTSAMLQRHTAYQQRWWCGNRCFAEEMFNLLSQLSHLNNMKFLHQHLSGEEQCTLSCYHALNMAFHPSTGLFSALRLGIVEGSRCSAAAILRNMGASWLLPLLPLSVQLHSC